MLRKRTLAYEVFEPRYLLVGDLIGAYGQHAALIADRNANPISFEVISDVVQRETTFLLGTTTDRVEVWQGADGRFERLRSFEGRFLAPLTAVGDRIYFAVETIVDQNHEGWAWPSIVYETQIWSIDSGSSEMRLELTPHRYSEGNNGDANVFIREIAGTIFIALTWYDFGIDSEVGEFWSDSSGVLTRYARTGGISSVRRFGDEFYVEIEEFALDRTNPLNRTVHRVWWRRVDLDGNVEFQQFEEVPNFEVGNSPFASQDWAAEAVEQLFTTETKTDSSANIERLIPNRSGVTFRDHHRELLFTDGDSIEVLMRLENPIFQQFVIETPDSSVPILHSDGQLEILSIEPSEFLLLDARGESPRLLATDGTEIGTSNALPAGTKVMHTNSVSSNPDGVTVLTSVGRVSGSDLYVSLDGSLWSLFKETPTLIAEKMFGLGISNFETLFADDRIWFWSGHSGSSGGRLWATNGTEEGTSVVASNAKDVSAIGDTVFFRRNDALWRADAAISEPTQVTLLPKVGRILYMTAIGDVMVLLDVNNRLWRSDGTSAGTELLRQFNDHPRDFAAQEEQLFFVATDEQHGTELWMSDATRWGTRLAVDVFPGPSDSRPEHVTLANDLLFFVADDGVHGRELWKVDISNPPLHADADTNGSVDFRDFLILALNFGRQTHDGPLVGDFDGDGLVQFSDFLILRHEYGNL